MTTSMTTALTVLAVINLIALLGIFSLIEQRLKRMQDSAQNRYEHLRGYLQHAEDGLGALGIEIKSMDALLEQMNDRQKMHSSDTKAKEIVFDNPSYPHYAAGGAIPAAKRDRDPPEGIDVELRDKFETLCDHLGVRVHRPLERYKVYEYPKGGTDAQVQASQL
jgi:hypothetical protein